MSGFKKGFLWGGAVAAHQLEGGWNDFGLHEFCNIQTVWKDRI